MGTDHGFCEQIVNMLKSVITTIAGAGIWMSLVSICPAAEHSGGESQAMNEKLVYTRLYTDEEGETHFEDKTFEFESPGGRDSLSAHPLEGVKSATLLKLKKGAVEDWHTAPRRQFLIIIQGATEVTVSDGEVRRFTPGTIALMDDTSGKGHITRNVGEEDHIALAIPVP